MPNPGRTTTMTSPLPNLGDHARAAMSLLGRRPIQVALALAAATVLLSIVLAPDTNPSTSEWVRIILIGVFGIGAILAFASSQATSTDPTDRSQRLVVAGVLVAIAIVLNLTFSLGSTILLSLGFTIAAFMTSNAATALSPWRLVGTILALIPFWVWSALDAWTWLLLVLIPVAALAVIADGHMRAAVGPADTSDGLLSARAHRLASWSGVLGVAVITLAAALVSDASNGVNALGALGAILLVGLEAGSHPAAPVRSRRSISITDAALLWVALCWIVSL
jgi:MFS family permease